MIQDAYDKTPALYFISPGTKPWTNKKHKRMQRLWEKVLRAPSRGFSLEYSQYIASDRWRKFRARVIRERGSMCERCGKVGSVQAHHISYARLGREKPEDVKLYCKPCHDLMHPPSLRRRWFREK